MLDDEARLDACRNAEGPQNRCVFTDSELALDVLQDDAVPSVEVSRSNHPVTSDGKVLLLCLNSLEKSICWATRET